MYLDENKSEKVTEEQLEKDYSIYTIFKKL